MLCEVTAQYWAWKNIDAKYIGFCHYRRYFNFSVNKYKENPYGEIIDGYIDGYSQQKYGLLDENMRPVIENYDLIHSPVYDLRTMPGKFSTPYEQYDAAPKLHIEDLEACAAITKQMYPEYAEDVDSYLQGHKSSFCNMYIMKKDLFDEYADWLFPILMKCIETADYTNYSVESLRTPGHLAERLFNIWLVHQNRVNQSLKSAELQVVHFDHPEKQDFRSHDIAPHSEKAVIPVVFAADNNYVPMVSTTIQSMLDNASRSYEYRIYVMQKDIAYENQELMRSMVARFPNAKIEFLSVDAIIDRYKLTTNNPHISVETYYRFLIQDLLPAYEKVLYLDSDLIVSGDVSVLYKTDLGDNLLAAARDIDYLGNLNMKDGKRLKYNEEILHMVNPYDYFQAGVLVLNTKAMRELMPMTRWLQIASNDEYIYNDQDVLNAACEGRVTYLDFSWNVMIDCAGRIGKVFSFAPADIYNAYLDSRRHELITHYAGFEKPWSMVGCDRSELYWQYARETPFYENLIGLMSGSSKKVSRSNMPPKAIGENNPIRKVVDPLMPLGTRRREVVKAVGRAVRGRTE
jgi:lipopolysaccharide biosynthesis glycosyltransferase